MHLENTSHKSTFTELSHQSWIDDRVRTPPLTFSSLPMPIWIMRKNPSDEEEEYDDEDIAFLCENEWLLGVQVDRFEEWLLAHASDLEPGVYDVNIGFKWRRSAGTGGPVLSASMLKQMADLGMSLYLSEWNGFADESHPD